MLHAVPVSFCTSSALVQGFTLFSTNVSFLGKMNEGVLLPLRSVLNFFSTLLVMLAVVKLGVTESVDLYSVVEEEVYHLGLL